MAITINGATGFSGIPIDGRDLAVDGPKLDTIETSATADQTDAEIKTAIEAATSIALGGSPTTTTQSALDNSTKISTTAYADAAVSAAIDAAPDALNTLNELAAALGDDANYAATTTTAIGTKLSKVGGAMTGPITTTSTFDGRSVSADGTKLDTIETSATADQTDAEIRTAVESATDSNVFTDADHSKLDAIEALATADQTNAEIKIAYEANDDTNEFSNTEQSKLAGIEVAATADQTDAEIRTAVDTATDSNVFTDADQTKLAGIEASATIDQTDAEIRAAVDAATDSNVFTDADNTKLDAIAASANNYTHPANHAISVITGLQSALDDKIDDSQVLTDVPSGAVFTDTTYTVGDGSLSEVSFTTVDNAKLDGIAASANNYSHPANHAISVTTGLQSALNSKAPLASPALTGAPTAPTAAANTNTTQVATTAYVQAEITDLIGGAPGTLNDLNELAAAINDDASYASTLTTALGTKVAKTSNQALSTAADAMTISGHTITLNRGDGTTDAVTVPDNNTDTDTWRSISNSVSSTSTTISASSAAVKAAYDRSWPDTDTNTTYSAGTGMSLSGTTFNCNINTPSEVGLSNLSSNGNNLSGDFTATGNITAYSDISLKSNIETIPNALDKVNSIRGVTFDMYGERATGVIAQELEYVLPEAVFDNDDGMKSVAYGNMAGLLIEAIKAQQVQIDELKALVGGA